MPYDKATHGPTEGVGLQQRSPSGGMLRALQGSEEDKWEIMGTAMHIDTVMLMVALRVGAKVRLGWLGDMARTVRYLFKYFLPAWTLK